MSVRPAAQPSAIHAAAGVDWDYSTLAAHYDRRAPYHPETVPALVGLGRLAVPAAAADIGAGTGRFSAALAEAGFAVDAIEPCAAMRERGLVRTVDLPVRWSPARGEATGLPAGRYALVSFASSFNVVAPGAALAEAARLLARDGAVACLWNHRDLDDPLQAEIERRIRARLPHYRHGNRREDPLARLVTGGRFVPAGEAALGFVHQAPSADFVDAFRAHATLVRQAGDALEAVLADIEDAIGSAGSVAVPFVTRLWVLRRSEAVP